MGLLQDVSSGMEGLLKKGDVGGLFVNVAHGMSNSAAKVSLCNLIFFVNRSIILTFFSGEGEGESYLNLQKLSGENEIPYLRFLL